MRPLSITHLATVGSTMDVAKSMLPATGAFAVLADQQTSGRGSGGRDWRSPLGNLYMTLAIPSSCVPMSVLPVLSLSIGIAVRNAMIAIEPEFASLRLKWPNDILHDKRKAGGSIVETHLDHLLIGIGLNLSVAPEVQDGGRPSCSLSEVRPVQALAAAEGIWTELMRLTGEGQTREGIISAFSAAMEWDITLFKRTTEGRDPRPLRPLRLTEWGQLVVAPLQAPQDAKSMEEILTAEYLF